MLERLDLKGAIVTIDAMGTQRAIAKKIQSAGADYILTLKANHPTLAQNAKDWLEKYNQEVEKTETAITKEFTCEVGPHRIEKRRFFSVPVEEVFDSKRIK